MTAPVLRLIEREAHILRRLWHSIAFSAFVQPLLYLLAMGVGIGGYVDDRTPTSLAGLSYVDFVAPGLLAASVFQLAVGESLWWVMGGTKWDKRYHAMVTTPLSADHVLAAHLSWESLRAAVTASAFLLVATVLGAVPSWWAPLAVPAAMLLVVAVASVVATWSTTVDSDRSFPVIMRLGVLPMFLFSGTFFPTSQLPDALRLLAPLSPLYHAVELCRAAMTGRSPGAGELVVHVLVLVAVAAAGTAAARRSFTRRLTP